MPVHPCPMPRCIDPDDPTSGNAPIVSTAICSVHARRLLTQLDTAPATYVALDLALGHRPQGAGEFVSRGKAAPPLPIAVATRALQEDLVRMLTEAELRLRVNLALSHVGRTGREGVRVTRASIFLSRRLDELLGYDDLGVDFALGLDKLNAAARRTLGLARLVHRLPAPCPSCDLLTLRRDDGASVVRCVNDACRRSFREDEYARLVLVLASDFS